FSWRFGAKNLQVRLPVSLTHHSVGVFPDVVGDLDVALLLKLILDLLLVLEVFIPQLVEETGVLALLSVEAGRLFPGQDGHHLLFTHHVLRRRKRASLALAMATLRAGLRKPLLSTMTPWHDHCLLLLRTGLRRPLLSTTTTRRLSRRR
uniref:Uncharacterized protein n=1 Tax=Triticum urartu TaxID=4572 RepID=A0A8R7QA42_TRIUA